MSKKKLFFRFLKEKNMYEMYKVLVFKENKFENVFNIINTIQIHNMMSYPYDWAFSYEVFSKSLETHDKWLKLLLKLKT